MEFRDVIRRVRKRVEEARRNVMEGRDSAAQVVKSIVDSFHDERIEKAFKIARESLAPSIDQLPVDFRLRRHSLPRRIYEKLFPVSHVTRISLRHDREFLDDFMPISNAAFVGRGSYKFVYLLPWSMVVKVARNVLPSDPIYGSLYREVVRMPDQFLTKEEMELMEFCIRSRRYGSADSVRLKFHRLGLERYHFWKVRAELPDYVLPTRFFMGIRYRRRPFGSGHYETLTPMDSQIMLVGKHMKEFANAGRPAEQHPLMQSLFPKYDFIFDSGKFGKIKKKILLKIREDLRRLMQFTQKMAQKERLILDIHSENIIITLPDFDVKVFDFHLFDEHLYGAGLTGRTERDLIEVIEKFVDSLNLED